MELFREIATELLKSEECSIDFPNLKFSIGDLVEMKCFKALLEIKKVIEDDTLDDLACFERIEKIICILEKVGSDGGVRHDFG